MVRPTSPAQNDVPTGGLRSLCEPCGQGLEKHDVDNRLNLPEETTGFMLTTQTGSDHSLKSIVNIINTLNLVGDFRHLKSHESVTKTQH